MKATYDQAQRSGRREGGSLPNPNVKDGMETTNRIEGMHCDGCAGGVSSLREGKRGEREADVSQAAGEVRVRYSQFGVDPGMLREIVAKPGHMPGGRP